MKNHSRAMVAAAVAGPRSVVTGTKASINSKGELLIYGVIGDFWDGLDAESVVRQAEQASAGKDQLIVRVHSEGGNIVTGLAIYNALKQSDKEVVVYVDGIAASMASAVVCAANIVRMPTNALMMIHKAAVTAWGNADDLRDLADQLEVLEGSYLDCYAQKGNQTIEQLKALVSDGKDHWLTAQQCLDMGFCDEILAEPVAVAATYRPEQFHNPPVSLWSNLVFQPKAATVAQSLENQAMKKFKIVASGGATLVAAIMTALVATYATVDDAVAKLSPLNVPDLEKLLIGETQASDDALSKLAVALNVQQAPVVAPPAVDAAAQAAATAAVALERARVSDIQALGTRHNLTGDQVQGFIASGITIADARSQVLDIVAARTSANQPLPGVRFNHAMGQAIHAAMATALLNRCNPQAYKIDDASKPFAHLPLIEMARAHLQAYGVDTTGMAPPAIAAMAMQTTSDFANILADVANKSLRMGYEAAPRTFTAFCRRVTASDFKPINRAQIGSGGGSLSQVNEKGEFKHGTLVDGKETYSMKTYGEILAITRKTLVNDDLGALGRIPAMQGAQVAETESEVVWNIILNNTVMSDTVALFHATHANLGTGVIASAGLSAGRTAMRKQKKLDGVTPMNLAPKFLIVPAALETTAQQMLAAVQPNISTSVNPFAGSMELLVEARLDAVSALIWYLAADPNRIDTIEYAYLEGQEGAYMETRNGFDVDGIEMKVRLDFAAGLIDYRGLYKSTGA
jgi:ATP-dependent protease ClpP protease subunit